MPLERASLAMPVPPSDGGVLVCSRGFNPIDVLVEDALVGPPDAGDTVEAFTDFIDRLLTQVDTSPSGVPSRLHARRKRHTYIACTQAPPLAAWANLP